MISEGNVTMIKNYNLCYLNLAYENMEFNIINYNSKN